MKVTKVEGVPTAISDGEAMVEELKPKALMSYWPLIAILGTLLISWGATRVQVAGIEAELRHEQAIVTQVQADHADMRAAVAANYAELSALLKTVDQRTTRIEQKLDR